MSEPRWWLEEIDPDAPEHHDGPVADIDEPEDQTGDNARFPEVTTDGA